MDYESMKWHGLLIKTDMNGFISGFADDNPILELRFYPNPAGQTTTLSLSPCILVPGTTFVLCDILGKAVEQTVLSPEQEEIVIDVSELPSGLYLARIVLDGRVLARGKIVVDR
jgi:hypothetical protein